MNEIEKLYENAGAKKIIPAICSNNELDCKGCIAYIENAIPYCKSAEYPPFTAEKQLKLVELLLMSKWWLNLVLIKSRVNFSDGLAEVINNLWQDLTSEEKDQIRSVLK